MKFAAIYLPQSMTKRPSRKGFKNAGAAWEYVYSQMCNDCKAERHAALTGSDWDGNEYVIDDGSIRTWPPSLHPGCSLEWDVVPHSSVFRKELKEMEVYIAEN